MKSDGGLEKIFSRKMLEIQQVFLRFFVKKSFQSLVIFHFKYLKLKRFGYELNLNLLLIACFVVSCSPFVAFADTISANPAAVNITPGTGELQRYIEKKLKIQNDHGIYIDGVWIADANDLFSGGIKHVDRLTTNSSLLLSMTADTEKLNLWKGGLFGVQFLQFNGQSTNKQAGSVQGYNSLPGPPPLNRFSLYELWYRQVLFNKKLLIRIGKVDPTCDFNNVVKPVPLQEDRQSIAAVTGLIYTPIFVNSSMIGVLPGYYNTAYGVTINFIPTKKWYLSLGAYDGHLAQGTQTGLTGPHFNGSYFYIGETGFAWLLGKNQLPGAIGLGAWHQTGLVQASPSVSEHDASGYYLFGSQRLWYKDPGCDNSGISAFYQYGTNNSHAMLMDEYMGAGLTAFGLVPRRADDSMGLGAAYAWLNQAIFARHEELMYQAYYQAKIINGVYVEPVLSYIPTPGASNKLNASWAGTLRAIILF